MDGGREFRLSSWAVTKWVVALAALAALLSSGMFILRTGSTPPGGGKHGGRGDQATWRLELLDSRRSLFDGELTYTWPRSAEVGGTYRFHARLTGVRTPQRSAPSPGRTATAEPVLVGGQVGAKLSCAGEGITCALESSRRQNLLTRGDAVNWTWTLTTRKPGTVHLGLVVTTYHLDTDTVLSERGPIEQELAVRATPSYTIGRAWNWILAVVGAFGAAAIGGSALFVWKRLRRRTGETQDTDAPAAQGS